MNTPVKHLKRKKSSSHYEIMDIELFGELTEGIYQLATIDQTNVKVAWQLIQESSFFGPKAIKGPIHKLFSRLFKRRLDRSLKKTNEEDLYRSSFVNLIKQYASGLSVSEEEALYLVYMNEFLNNPGAIFDEIEDHHLRDNNYESFINSPIQGSFFEKLRFIHFKCEQSLEAYILQDLLSPFAPYGGLNEAGLSVSLVQKEALKLNYEGENASFLALATLLGHDTIESACEFLSKRQLVFHWEFHIKDKHGNYRVVAIDGKDAKVINRDGHSSKLESTEIFKEHQKAYQKFGQPLSHACLSYDNKSMALSLFDSQKELIQFYFKQNLFNEQPKIIVKSAKAPKKIRDLFKLKNHLNNAQIAFNENHEEECYHHLQLAINHANKNIKDKALNAKLKLIFCTCQYIYESHKETYQFILSTLYEIHSNLDPYHQELANILIQRIQILTDQKVQTPTTNKLLKRVLFNESQLGKLAHMALKKTTLLRPNHFDFRPISGL